MAHRQLPKCFRWEAMGVLPHGTMTPGNYSRAAAAVGKEKFHFAIYIRTLLSGTGNRPGCLRRSRWRPLHAIPSSIPSVCTGPDLFFYYKPLSKNPVSRLGHEFHDRPGRDFFERAARVLQMHPDSLAHRAYVYGFLCHFALDTLSHDYVAEKEAASGLSHARIESELERALMLRDGLDPASHRPTGHLVPSEENAAVIADFFPEVTQEQVLDSLRGMVFYLDLLVAPSALKRWVIFTALAPGRSV